MIGRTLAHYRVTEPDIGQTARGEFGKWFDAELVEHLIDGLRKAGLEVPST